MGTIVDKLNYLAETKAEIKKAINDKGVKVRDDDTFRSYAEKIASISGGGAGGGTFLAELTLSNVVNGTDITEEQIVESAAQILEGIIGE